MRSRCALVITATALGLAACQAPSGSHSAPSPEAAKTSTPPAPAVPLPPLVDEVSPDNDAAEHAHNQQGDSTETGQWTERTYRHSSGGWFSYDMKSDPTLPNQLVITYAGVDKRAFQVLIDGKLLTDKAQSGSTDDFYDQAIAIPPEMTRGKSKITVKFQSVNGGYAGGIYGLKVMRVTPK